MACTGDRGHGHGGAHAFIIIWQLAHIATLSHTPAQAPAAGLPHTHPRLCLLHLLEMEAAFESGYTPSHNVTLYHGVLISEILNVKRRI